jgi:O-antigen/teichoic acid export membrane protein
VNSAAVGIYSLALVLAEKLYMVGDAVGSSLFIRISRSNEISEIEYSALIFRITMIVLLPVALLAGILSDVIVYVLFGEEFQDTAHILRILLIAFVLQAGWRIIWLSLAGYGKIWWVALTNLFMSIVNISIAVSLLPIYGIEGAAYALTAASIVGILVGAWQLSHLTPGLKYYDVLMLKRDDLNILRQVAVGYITRSR